MWPNQIPIWIAGGVLGGGVATPAWSPLSPTTDGNVSAHTIMCPALGLTPFFQDSGKTTAAAADGDPIGAFDNPGTDGYDAVQATSSAKPSLKLNILNGKPVLRFDGGDFLRGAFAGGALAQPFTIFVIANLDASIVNGGSRYFMDSDDSTNRMIVGQFGGPDPDEWLYSAGANILGGATNANYNTHTIQVNGASSATWINGVSVGTGNIGAHTFDGITIGGSQGAGERLVGDIPGILIYPGNLSTADKNQIGQWAASTFALSYTDIT